MLNEASTFNTYVERGLWGGTAREGILAVFGFLAIFFHDFLQLSVICFRLYGVSLNCRVYLSVFAVLYRMLLSMIVVGSWLSNIGGCRSGVGCRLSLSAVAPTLSIVGT